MDVVYLVSQAFVIIQYIFLIITYQVKTQKQILVFNTFSQVCAIMSFLCLGAYSGSIMSFVSLLRNYLFYNSKSNFKLIFIFILLLIFTICTYNGVLSLMPALGTLLYTYSVWQQDTDKYRVFGIFIELSWLIYCIYVFSFMGIVFEIVLLISIVIGIKRGKEHI